MVAPQKLPPDQNFSTFKVMEKYTFPKLLKALFERFLNVTTFNVLDTVLSLRPQ